MTKKQQQVGVVRSYIVKSFTDKIVVFDHLMFVNLPQSNATRWPYINIEYDKSIYNCNFVQWSPLLDAWSVKELPWGLKGLVLGDWKRVLRGVILINSETKESEETRKYNPCPTKENSREDSGGERAINVDHAYPTVCLVRTVSQEPSCETSHSGPF